MSTYHIDNILKLSQKIDLKIVMSSTFLVIRMPTLCPSIWYKVNEVANVDSEIIRQIIEWDCEQASTIVKAIVYCLTDYLSRK
jgi:hypothetical protein